MKLTSKKPSADKVLQDDVKFHFERNDSDNDGYNIMMMTISSKQKARSLSKLR